MIHMCLADENEKQKLSLKEANKPEHHHDIAVILKYRDYKPVISEIKIVSTPSRKKYVTFKVMWILSFSARLSGISASNPLEKFVLS